MRDVKLDRRTVLAVAGAAGAFAAGLDTTARAAGRKSFPRGFRWGASTAAHQIEGNGRGQSREARRRSH